MLTQSILILTILCKCYLLVNTVSTIPHLADTLTNRIQELSNEMEAIIAWIQKSSDLVGRLNHIKYQLTELSNKETDAQSIQWKIRTLKVQYYSLSLRISPTNVIELPQGLQQSRFSISIRYDPNLTQNFDFFGPLSPIQQYWLSYLPLQSL